MNKQFVYKVRRASSGKVIYRMVMKDTTISAARARFFELIYADIDHEDEILHIHFTDKGIVVFAEGNYKRYSLEY